MFLFLSHWFPKTITVLVPKPLVRSILRVSLSIIWCPWRPFCDPNRSWCLCQKKKLMSMKCFLWSKESTVQRCTIRVVWRWSKTVQQNSTIMCYVPGSLWFGIIVQKRFPDTFQMESLDDLAKYLIKASVMYWCNCHHLLFSLHLEV